MKQSIYLDHAAATPLDPGVLRAMQPYFSEFFYNPSATYMAGQKAHQDLEAARARVAHWLGSRPSEVIFTAGGTEANNLAVTGIMQRFPDATLLVSAVEHESVLEPARSYGAQLVAVDATGIVDMADLRAKIDDHTVLVSIMYANNEVGSVQPIREISHLINDVRNARRAAGNELPLYLHSDACQAGNYLDIHVARLGVDLLTLNGSKLYGPKQTGALYVRAGITLTPLVAGGGQEHGLRSGTENVAGSIGFACALDQAQTIRHDEAVRLQTLQHVGMELITKHVPAAVINGSRNHRLANNIHVTLPGMDNERLLIQLDEAGILAAAGSACSASNEEPSHVLRAMGMSDADAQSSLRFTMGRSTTQADIETLVETLAGLVNA